MAGQPLPRAQPVVARGGSLQRLIECVLTLRDRWLADPRFQRRAADLPLVRTHAQREARALFDLCAGFVYSQVLAACVQLRLFDLLQAEGALAAEQIGDRIDLPAERTLRLLEAAAALGLVQRRPGGRFGLGPRGAALQGNPGVKAMIDHHALLYEDLRDPVALLRGAPEATRLARFWRYGPGDGTGQVESAEYTRLMAASQHLVAGDVLDGYPFHRHRALLDVGGGCGAFVAEVAARVPHLELALVDLPAVAPQARQWLAERGLAQRVTVHGRDALHEALPAGADLVTLVRVLHDHDDEDARRLLRAVHAALPGGGTLLIAEPMTVRGAEAVGAAYFGMYLLAMGRGRPRTPQQILALAAEAGFADGRRLRTRRPLLTGLVACRRR